MRELIINARGTVKQKDIIINTVKQNVHMTIHRNKQQNHAILTINV